MTYVLTVVKLKENKSQWYWAKGTLKKSDCSWVTAPVSHRCQDQPCSGSLVICVATYSCRLLGDDEITGSEAGAGGKGPLGPSGPQKCCLMSTCLLPCSSLCSLPLVLLCDAGKEWVTPKSAVCCLPQHSIHSTRPKQLH